MVFLPGDHVLDMNVTVANIARLTMHGDIVVGQLVTLLCFCDLYYVKLVNCYSHSNLGTANSVTTPPTACIYIQESKECNHTIFPPVYILHEKILPALNCAVFEVHLQVFFTAPLSRQPPTHVCTCTH